MWGIPGFPIVSNQLSSTSSFDVVRILAGDGRVQGIDNGEGLSDV